MKKESEIKRKMKDEMLMLNSMKKEEMTKEQLKAYEEKMAKQEIKQREF